MAEFHENLISPDEGRTLDGMFVVRTRRSADAPAYGYYDGDAKRWRTYTWAEAGAVVARWRAALAAEGLVAGDRVAIQLRNCPEWVFFDVAALSLGLVTVPLYTDDRADNIAYILRETGAKLLLVQDAGRWRRLSPAMGEVETLRRVWLLDGADPDDERVAQVAEVLPDSAEPMANRHGDPHALATIVFTSGTTGRPKGVMLSHNNIMSVAHNGLKLWRVYQEDVLLSFLPLSHTLERTGGLYLPIMTGSSVHYSRSIGQLAEDLLTIRPSVLMAVPRIFDRVHGRIKDKLAKGPGYARFLFGLAIKIGWRRFEREQGRAGWSPGLLLWPLLDRLVAAPVRARLGGRMRIAISGGAPLNPGVARTFIALGVPIIQGYGLTETAPVISVNTLEANIPDSAGIPLPGVEVRIGPDDEIQARGPNIMQGYWNNHAATKQVVDHEGWFRTGDQGRLGPDNRIFITGRLKDILVLSNGEKVPPADMELAIAMDPAVEQVMVVGEGRSYLCALVVLSGEAWPALAQSLGLDPMAQESLVSDTLKKDLLSRIRSALKDFPGYAKIRRVSLTLDPWTVENEMLTPTMKVKRPQVSAHHAADIEAMYDGALDG